MCGRELAKAYLHDVYEILIKDLDLKISSQFITQNFIANMSWFIVIIIAFHPDKSHLSLIKRSMHLKLFIPSQIWKDIDMALYHYMFENFIDKS